MNEIKKIAKPTITSTEIGKVWLTRYITVPVTVKISIG